MQPTPSLITATLAEMVDSYLVKDLVNAKVVQEIAIDDKNISLRLLYPYPLNRQINEIKQKVNGEIQRRWPDYQVQTTIQWKVRRHKVQKGLKPKSVIKNIIAVASGKGGVGKSTVAVNLALGLKGLGATVALLDADIYGPSLPRMLGMNLSQAQTHNKKFLPIKNYGIENMSMGYLVDELSAMIWRGPMVSSALQQLLNETAWQECDYMIVDLPPGTGDIQLTMAQKIPISGAVVVTTPQDIALLDAKKAYKMFEKVNVPVLGVIENMSGHVCSQCGHVDAIFGEGGGKKMAEEFHVPLLAQLPLDKQVRLLSDKGTPIMVADPNSALAQPFWEMATQVAAKLALREVEPVAMLPEMLVSET